MKQLLIFLLFLCVTSLEAATITNWGAQLPTAVPASGDVILMQNGGVTYYFTPTQLATQLSTNANMVTGASSSNALYSIIIANDTETSNALRSVTVGGLTNKIDSLNGLATNTTFYTALNLAASALPTTSNSVDGGSFLLPLRTNWVNNSIVKQNATIGPGTLTVIAVSNGTANILTLFSTLGSQALTVNSNGQILMNVATSPNPIDILGVNADTFIKLSSPNLGAETGLLVNNAVALSNSWFIGRTSDGGGAFKIAFSDTVYPIGTLSTPLNISAGPNFVFTMAGTLSAGIAEVVAATSATLSVQNSRGNTINNFGQAAANTQTLPTAAVGLNGIVQISATGVGAFHLKAGPNDKIYLDGVALDDGDKASLAAPSIGDWFSFVAFKTGASTYDWLVTSGSGTLTDGGP